MHAATSNRMLRSMLAQHAHRADDDGDAWILQQYGQLECKGLSACIHNIFIEMRCWGADAWTSGSQSAYCGRINNSTSCWKDQQRILSVQDGFASLKLKAAKGPVAVVRLQLLMQQLALLMRHQASRLVVECKRALVSDTTAS
jgi:hypothetical protein